MKKGLLIFVLMVFLTGCAYTQNIPTFKGESKAPTGKGIGLQLPVIKEVFEGDNIQIDLTLYNYNSEPISGTVKISDALSDDFGGIQGTGLEQTFSIEGFGENDPAPQFQDISFNPNPYSLNGLEKLNSNILVEVLYDYDLTVQSQICFKKKDTRVPGVINCNPNSLSGVQLGRTNALSPVTVSRIDVQTSETKEGLTVGFVLHIQNVGGGFINNEKETIEDLSVELIGRGRFNCRPTSVSLRENREGVISCAVKVPLSEGQFINDPLRISFKFPYRYAASISNIEIKKAL